MDKDRAEGRRREIEGIVSQVAGEIVGNQAVKVKGRAKQGIGNMPAAFGDVKSDVNKAVS